MQQKQALSAAQTKAHSGAVHKFIAMASVKYGRGSVILLPKFVEDADGNWIPENVNTPVRSTNDKFFLRFGKQYTKQTAKGSEVAYMFTNRFGDSADDLDAFLSHVSPDATIGSAVRNCRIVRHESLNTFTKMNPKASLKFAGDNTDAENVCVKYLVNPDTAEVEKKPIYMTHKFFFPDDNGVFPKHTPQLFRVIENRATGEYAIMAPNGRKVREDFFLNDAEVDYNDRQIEECAMKTAEDRLIQHDNYEELSDKAIKRLGAVNNAKIAVATKQAALDIRIAELQGKATLTAAEQIELNALVPVTAAEDNVPF
jgi:hypothetical protein